MLQVCLILTITENTKYLTFKYKYVIIFRESNLKRVFLCAFTYKQSNQIMIMIIPYFRENIDNSSSKRILSLI